MNKLFIALRIGAVLLAGCGLSSCVPNAAAHSLNAAVYAEYSDSDLPMKAGWNTRIFNRREVQQSRSISLEDRTGVITLAPGNYHITASSIVTYFDPKVAALTVTQPAPAAGYARLRYLDDVLADQKTETGATNPSQSSIDKSNERALAVSTVSDVNLLPSLLDTFVKVEKESKIVLEHQIGSDVKNIYLHVNGNGSTWHIFARISIQQV